MEIKRIRPWWHFTLGIELVVRKVATWHVTVRKCVRCERDKISSRFRLADETCKRCRTKRRRKLLKAKHAKDTEAKRRYIATKVERNRARLAAHPEKRRAYHAKRMAEDVQYRIAYLLRKRVKQVLRGERKSAPTLALLGCSLADFRKHIESKFKRGMTWENWGTKWHLDHIFPCDRFDLTRPEEQRRCFHWTNFQPLPAKVNCSKGAKITQPKMSLLFGW
jgi:hypothetical protein